LISKGKITFQSFFMLMIPVVHLRLAIPRLVQTSGTGIGPKNIRRAFSFPITRTSSCIMQYMTISTNRMIWIAQKCG